jgi:phosphatidylglycerophosphatase A
MLVAIAASVPLCRRSEELLRQKDPSSVVLDEIVAIPLCFLGWIGTVYFSEGRLLQASDLFLRENVGLTISLFVAFRAFDIAKPWPIRQSQNFQGGWGVVVDDLLAALYVLAASLLFEWLKTSFARA